MQGRRQQSESHNRLDSIPPTCLNGDKLETMLLEATTQYVENGTPTVIPGFASPWRADRDR